MDPLTLASLAGMLTKGGGAEAGSGLAPGFPLLELPSTLFKTITGVGQMIRGDEMGRTERPTMQIPTAQNEALQTARGMAMNPRLPGQGLMQDQLDLQGAGGVRGVEGLGAGSAERIAGFGNLNRGLMDQTRNIGISAAQNQASNLRNLQNALQAQAQWQQKAWDYNVDQPFQETMASSLRNTDAGNANVAGGLKEAGGLLASTMGTQGGPQSQLIDPQAPQFQAPEPNFGTPNIQGINPTPTKSVINQFSQDQVTPMDSGGLMPGTNPPSRGIDPRFKGMDMRLGATPINTPTPSFMHGNPPSTPYVPGTNPWSQKANDLFGPIFTQFGLK